MALDAIIRKAVAIADKQTRSVQEDVIHHAWTGQLEGGQGGDAYVSVLRRAIVEHKVTQVQVGVRVVPVQAKLTFLEPIDPHGATGRVEPLDPRDEFELMDGTRGPVVDVEGMRDPAKRRPFLAEVYLGVR